MENIAGWRLSTGDGIFLFLIFYGIPAIIIYVIIGLVKGIRGGEPKEMQDIAFNPAYNLKQETPEVKQFIPAKDETQKKQNHFIHFYIGLALLLFAIGTYVALSFIVY